MTEKPAGDVWFWFWFYGALATPVLGMGFLAILFFGAEQGWWVLE